MSRSIVIKKLQQTVDSIESGSTKDAVNWVHSNKDNYVSFVQCLYEVLINGAYKSPDYPEDPDIIFKKDREFWFTIAKQAINKDTISSNEYHIRAEMFLNHTSFITSYPLVTIQHYYELSNGHDDYGYKLYISSIK